MEPDDPRFDSLPSPGGPDDPHYGDPDFTMPTNWRRRTSWHCCSGAVALGINTIVLEKGAECPFCRGADSPPDTLYVTWLNQPRGEP